VKFFGGVEHGPRTNRLEFGGDPEFPITSDPGFQKPDPGTLYLYFLVIAKYTPPLEKQVTIWVVQFLGL